MRDLLSLFVIISLLLTLSATVIAGDGGVVSSDHQHETESRETLIRLFETHFGSPGDMTIQADEVHHDEPVRCLTPFIIGYDEVKEDLQPETRKRFRQLTATDEITDEHETYETEHFRLIYQTEGPDSVWTKESGLEEGVPRYIVKAGEYAEYSYQRQVMELGYENPLDNDRCYPSTGSRINIRFENLGSQYYGFFSTPDTLVVHSTFDHPDFQNNDDEEDGPILGALKVTIAHELKHAIQYVTNCFEGDAGSFDWVEMDATMMEEVVFPQVNDYHNYIGGTAGIFGNPQSRFPKMYSHVTFMLYYDEDFGSDFWVDVWDVIGEEYDSGVNIAMLDAMSRVLVDRNNETADEHIDLETSLLRNYLWHLASGNRSLENYGFAGRFDYPVEVEPSFFGSFDENIPHFPFDEVSVPYHAARFFEFEAGQLDTRGDVAMVLFNRERPLGVGLLGKKQNGDVVEYLIPPDGTKRQKLLFPVEWEDLDWLGVVTMNTKAYSSSNDMQLLAGAGSAEENQHDPSPAIERLLLGDVTHDSLLSKEDARWMLQTQFDPSPLAAYPLYIGDVTGDGRLTHYDAAWVYKYLDNKVRVFPVDENLSGLGPKQQHFKVFDADDGTVFPGPGQLAYGKPAPLKSSGQTGQGDQQANKLSTSLRIDQDGHKGVEQVTAEREMELVVSIPGAADSTWHSLYLDLAIDFPPPDGESEEKPIKLSLIDVSPGSGDSGLQGWEYELSEDRLRIALASSDSLGSTNEPGDVLKVHLIPENEGDVRFRIADLELEEKSYVFSHSDMDTLHVMKPVATAPPDELPAKLSLQQNYPNPFNPETIISFALPETAPVRLQLFDITGRLVTTLVDEQLSGGHHRVRFDTREHSAFSSGVYIYRLQAAGEIRTRKMTIVK